MRVLRILMLLALLGVLGAVAPVAHAGVLIPTSPVAGNPADRLLAHAIEPAIYERATRCLPNSRRPGTDALVAWLSTHARGVFWGAYRCEIWGEGSASLHAEKRAVDWHLDASQAADRRAAARLIALLTAPDAHGNAHALARRMGIEEIIWDCGYWGAGMPAFRPYSPCLDRRGQPRDDVHVTIAHRDHIHLGLTRAGALGRTSFWRSPPAAARERTTTRPAVRDRPSARPRTRRSARTRRGTRSSAPTHATTHSGRRSRAPAAPSFADVAPPVAGGAQAPAGLR